MYGKAFKSMYTGSMVGAGPVKFTVWHYAITYADPPGIVELNPKLLAAIIGGCTEADIEEAIAWLCAPDPRSRSTEHEGRRLLKCGAFAYEVPTWAKYNKIRNSEDRRQQNVEAARRYREKKRKEVEQA